MTTTAATDRGRKLLVSSPLCSALDERGRRELVARAQPRHFAAGASICRVGEPGTSKSSAKWRAARGRTSTDVCAIGSGTASSSRKTAGPSSASRRSWRLLELP